MDQFDEKLLKIFPGKIVRKDLTALMKKGANVPTYVLEYLLGLYCASDDQEIIDRGMAKIKQVLTENYVRPGQSELIKSKIRENGQYTIIDKVSVELLENEDRYLARFTNLEIAPFYVSTDLVVNNQKLLLGGIWCIVKISYTKPNQHEEIEEDEDIFGNKKKKKSKKPKYKYDSPFDIINLKPIQMPNLNIEEIIDARDEFTKDEWVTLLLRSAGYEPKYLTEKQKMHLLLRMVPLVQKNYNLVELGPRGTGKSHLYSELSPYSILISAGHTTVSNMFYNMSSRRVGLVGHWDCIAFDEVGGMKKSDTDTFQTLKNYMANGSFARGTDSINADASIAFEGNTFKTVSEMLRTSNLFEPFPEVINNDAAFFDRIHAYLPGWETPKLRNELLTNRFAFISDCLTGFFHELRKYDFTNSFSKYFELNTSFNTRDSLAVTRTFSGLVKLIYPDENYSKEECREMLEYAIECRRRVKEQLKKMVPTEFNDTKLGYIDLDTNEEFIINVPEQPSSNLVFEGLEIPGYVYAIGRASSDRVAIYRLENKKIHGEGKMLSKNIEGVSNHHQNVRSSINAAFNYFLDNSKKIINLDPLDYDYSLYFNDLQSRGVSDEVSVAEVVGLCSALAGRSVLPKMAIVGKVVISGSMLSLSLGLDEIVTAALGAGVRRLLLPNEAKEAYDKIPESLKGNITPIFYSTAIDAVKKAFGID